VVVYVIGKSTPPRVISSSSPLHSRHQPQQAVAVAVAVADDIVARLLEVNVLLLGLFCRFVGLFCGYICWGLLLTRVWHGFLR